MCIAAEPDTQTDSEILTITSDTSDFIWWTFQWGEGNILFSVSSGNVLCSREVRWILKMVGHETRIFSWRVFSWTECFPPFWFGFTLSLQAPPLLFSSPVIQLNWKGLACSWVMTRVSTPMTSYGPSRPLFRRRFDAFSFRRPLLLVSTGGCNSSICRPFLSTGFAVPM